MTVDSRDAMDSFAATDDQDDFDALLAGSSLGAPHVIAESDQEIPASVRERFQQALTCIRNDDDRPLEATVSTDVPGESEGAPVENGPSPHGREANCQAQRSTAMTSLATGSGKTFSHFATFWRQMLWDERASVRDKLLTGWASIMGPKVLILIDECHRQRPVAENLYTRPGGRNRRFCQASQPALKALLTNLIRQQFAVEHSEARMDLGQCLESHRASTPPVHSEVSTDLRMAGDGALRGNTLWAALCHLSREDITKTAPSLLTETSSAVGYAHAEGVLIALRWSQKNSSNKREADSLAKLGVGIEPLLHNFHRWCAQAQVVADPEGKYSPRCCSRGDLLGYSRLGPAVTSAHMCESSPKKPHLNVSSALWRPLFLAEVMKTELTELLPDVYAALLGQSLALNAAAQHSHQEDWRAENSLPEYLCQWQRDFAVTWLRQPRSLRRSTSVGSSLHPDRGTQSTNGDPKYIQLALTTTAEKTPETVRPPSAIEEGFSRIPLHSWCEQVDGATVLRAAVTMQLLSRGEEHPVATRLTYRSDDPYAVAFTFNAGSDAEVAWTFARTLLVEGLRHSVGSGDVVVWTEPEESLNVDSSRLVLSLSSPSGTALLTMPQDDAKAYLRQTQRIVPLGSESHQLQEKWRDLEGRLLTREAESSG